MGNGISLYNKHSMTHDCTIGVILTILLLLIISFISHHAGGRGNWNTSGCTLRSYNSTTNVAVCDCDHLTNFACLVVSIYLCYIATWTE